MINTTLYTNKFIIYSSSDLHAHMKHNLCESLPIKFDTLYYPMLHVEYRIYVPAMLRSKYILANKGYARHEFYFTALETRRIYHIRNRALAK